jgi:phosphopentomutase
MSAMRPRLAILVLDGLGIGAQPDGDQTDAGSDTLRHVLASNPGLDLPNLRAMGLLHVAGIKGDGVPASFPTRWPVAAGRSALGYPGADTYLGHLVMMGVPAAEFSLDLLRATAPIVTERLRAAGHSVQPSRRGSALVVDGQVLVADNVEAARGLGVNVTASTERVPFEALLAIGHVVRAAVSNPRVIVVGATGFEIGDILEHLVERSPGQIGVDTPGLGVYRRPFDVRHLGSPAGEGALLTRYATDAGLPVVLLGKAADVIGGPAKRDNAMETDRVLGLLGDALDESPEGLFVANVQETDLAGHSQDPARFASILAQIDQALPRLLAQLTGDDVLMVTADHGNDPCSGHSGHTREYVPLLAAGPRVTPADIGTRESLADIGATAADLLHLQASIPGASFAHALRGSEERP